MSIELKMFLGQNSEQDVLNNLMDKRNFFSIEYDDARNDAWAESSSIELQQTRWGKIFVEC